MKLLLSLLILVTIGSILMAQSPETKPAPAKLASTIFDWEKMQTTNTANGVRRDLFDAPTATLDKINCHITTLKHGANSGEPRRHLQEEVIVIKEGLVEATVDGRTQTAGPGSDIFF